MYIGTQGRFETDEELQVLSQLGINNVDITPAEPWTEWTTDTFVQMREQCAKFSIELELTHLPLRGRPAIAGNLDEKANDNYAGVIFLGPSDERERAIDRVHEVIKMASEAGLRGLQYNITVLGHMRTERSTGRGGASLSTFKFDEMDHSLGEFEGGAADLDTMWERIDYWLQKVIPVAEEYKIQMCCHPSDPGIGMDNTYRDVARPLGMPEGFKKFVQMYDSDYNGLNFCQGCMSEALENPGEEIFDVIRWFGERKKIFNVHFRNIKGGLNNFSEVFPDEGDIDMLKALQVYKEVGYPYMIMPDHVPVLSGPAPREVGFAYSYGYIHAAMQVVDSE